MSKNLVIYYSRRGQNYVSGNIRELEKGNAEIIAGFTADAAAADIFEVRPVKEYPEDYMACTEVAQEELRQNARPELKEYLDDVSGYDRIFVCGPCWWGIFPMAIYTQAEKLDWNGKKVNVLVTHEGSGMGSCERDLAKVLTGAKFGKGLAVHGADASRSEKTVAAWAASQI